MTDQSKEQETTTIREAVGVFHEWNALQAAVDELESSGFDRAELSLLAGEQAVQDKLGHVYEKVADLEAQGRRMGTICLIQTTGVRSGVHHQREHIPDLGGRRK